MRVFILEDDVLHVGECGADALQQQVERLDGDELLLPLLLQAVFSSGAQRETQVQLPRQKHRTPIRTLSFFPL